MKALAVGVNLYEVYQEDCISAIQNKTDNIRHEMVQLV